MIRRWSEDSLHGSSFIEWLTITGAAKIHVMP